MEQIGGRGGPERKSKGMGRKVIRVRWDVVSEKGTKDERRGWRITRRAEEIKNATEFFLIVIDSLFTEITHLKMM